MVRAAMTRQVKPKVEEDTSGISTDPSPVIRLSNMVGLEVRRFLGGFCRAMRE